MKLCECGCGEPAPIAIMTSAKWGHVAGQPMRYVRGHANRKPLAERFAKMVRPAADLSPNGMSGCLIWTGRARDTDYAQVRFDGSRMGAHVAAWGLAGRVVPEGYHLDHLCRRPACVNVEHLEAVTPTENKRRGRATKLTAEKAAEIRRLRCQGWVAQDIADAYGVSRDRVYKIARGEGWA
jgi:hypothetical protein